MSRSAHEGEGNLKAGSRAELETLAWLVEEAYSGDPDHSLQGNLRELKDEDWNVMPSGGGRSIADILEHVGWCKWMYEDYAFGSATLRGDRPPLVPAGGQRARPKAELLDWLDQGQRRWLTSVKALSVDNELSKDRLTNWGEWLPTRTIIRIMIAHDFYHAGEINHIRALIQKNDYWPYDVENQAANEG